MRTIVMMLVGLVWWASSVAAASELIDLAAVAPQPCEAGQVFEVALPASCPGGPDGQVFAGAQVLVQYDPAVVRLIGWCPAEYQWWNAEPFIPDGQGINLDIGDGEAIAVLFGDPAGLPTAPLVLGYLRFVATRPGVSPVVIAGTHPSGVRTRVAGYGEDLTGVLQDDWVWVLPPPAID
jgi:hypothetical protein